MSDEKFRQFVKGFAHIGYGRMMQIVTEEWYKAAIKKGESLEGVLVGRPLGLLEEAERQQVEQELSLITGKTKP